MSAGRLRIGRHVRADRVIGAGCIRIRRGHCGRWRRRGGTVAYEDNALYAGRSIYRCDNGESLEVNNTVTQVVLGLSDGSVMELPASPADSHTRYVKDQYAFVFDGTEALFFRPKAAP